MISTARKTASAMVPARGDGGGDSLTSVPPSPELVRMCRFCSGHDCEWHCTCGAPLEEDEHGIEVCSEPWRHRKRSGLEYDFGPPTFTEEDIPW